jgi:hypothetical protein
MIDDCQTIKMASLNPENNSQILLTVDVDTQGSTQIILCCEDTMLLNAFMSLLKKAFLAAFQ